MLLLDKLKTLDKNEDVYIGSKSAFFYMDKPDLFENMIDELDGKFKYNFAKSIKSAEYKIEMHKPLKPTKGARENRIVYENGKRVLKQLTYKDLLELWQERLNKLQSNLKRAKRNYDEYKDLKDRKVIDCYKSINGDATIVIVEGREASRFWFKSEYERFKKGEVILIDSDEEEED